MAESAHKYTVWPRNNRKEKIKFIIFFEILEMLTFDNGTTIPANEGIIVSSRRKLIKFELSTS